jgi:membrane associated rhomboid family serine protease
MVRRYRGTVTDVSSPQIPPARSRKQQRRDELINTSVWSSLRPTHPGGAAFWTLIILAGLWILALVNSIDHHHLSRHLAITPRHTHGLLGILTSPLFHSDASQLAANSIPFAVMCWLMLWSGLGTFALVTALGWLVSGGVDWLVGPSDAHIVGVSGVIFAWMGYILARAFYGRSLRWIGIAIAVVAVFSSTFGGLLPGDQHNVYWGGHVAGFVIGVAIAAALHRRVDKKRASKRGREQSPL